MTTRMGRSGRSHADYRLLAAAAVDGRIAPDDAAALEAHLATCDSCRADQHAMFADHAWLATPAQVTPPQASVRAAVLAAARAPVVPRVGPSMRPWSALSAAALVIAVVGLGIFLAADFGPATGPGASPSSVECPVQSAGLTAWWPFESGVEDAVVGRTGRTYGSARFAPGIVGNALTLDGLDAYADVPHDPSLELGPADFTVILWVRFSDLADEQVLVEQWHDREGGWAVAEGWTLTKLVDGTLLFTSEGNGGANGVSAYIPDLRTDEWYLVAITRSGHVLSMIVNASVVARQTYPTIVDIRLDTPLLFGRREDHRELFLAGQLDEIQIYVGRALSETYVEAMYDSQPTGACPTRGALTP